MEHGGDTTEKPQARVSARPRRQNVRFPPIADLRPKCDPAAVWRRAGEDAGEAQPGRELAVISKFQTLWALGLVVLVLALAPYFHFPVVLVIGFVGSAVSWAVWIGQWRTRTKHKPVEKPE